MSVNEQMVQDIVQEVVAKMQIASDVTGNHGVFQDMNTAIEAAKKTQRIVARMSMDQREKIISNIRGKIKEHAEIFARMGVQETGMGNVGHKILKHQLVAEKTPTWNRRYSNNSLVRRQRADTDRDGTFRGHRRNHSMYQSKRDGAVQYDRHAGGRQYSGIQSPSGSDQDIHLCHQSDQ